MVLRREALADTGAWKKAGVELPRFDIGAMIAATEKEPAWVHFGAGNIFRAFPAVLQQTLLDEGIIKTGIITAAGYDGEIIDRIFLPHDNLTLSVTLKADGGVKKKLVASIACALRMDRPENFSRLKEIFRAPSLQMASFTITEKGYAVTGANGVFLPAAAADIEAGPSAAKSYMGQIAALCYQRFIAGSLPLTLVSMDNCSRNGDRIFTAVDAFARGWAERGLAEKGFAEYILDRRKVSFPWSMIDKITPRPDSGVKAMLEKDGFTGMNIHTTVKNSCAAPFVNSEETQYLVIEDAFPAGRPPLEKAGVLFTDRDTVDKAEKMKVCTCLNPLHTALAVFGCLLGYTKICDEMQDADLPALIELIGYKEGLPAAVDPGIISPKDFIDQAVKLRFPNPYMPDTPQRIAADTSVKIPIRFGETLKTYRHSAVLNTADLEGIPLVLAAWLRYLLGINDSGNAFTVSPDPQYEVLSRRLAGLSPGQKGPFHKTLEPVLSDANLFGLDLYEAGLGAKVEGYFTELMAGPGAVRSVLHNLVHRA